MKVTVKLLKQLVDFDYTLEELCNSLTLAGLEVETIHSTAEMFQDMIVAKITAIKQHPNSDKLHLCEVDYGDGTCSIICGAPNVIDGATVALAHPGTDLPGGGTVEKVIIRDVESEGMLLSERELGLELESTGIMILDPGLKPGTPLVEALDLADDIIEFEITPNRSDCLSLLGIAREIAAFTRGAFTRSTLRPPASSVEETGDPVCDACRVTIQNGDLCYRYCARLVRNVNVGPSPMWLKSALFKLGSRPINNVVDVTNYILLEMGQPLHAFDYDILAGHEIIVRTSCPGETITTLDGEVRTLPTKALLICDGQRPVAVAGVMGGENTFITADTRNVLLESAHFDPVSVRVTARSLGLSTDSSYRFERGVDNENVPRSLDRAARLIAELSGGTVAPGMIDVVGKPVERISIQLRARTVKRVLGLSLSGEEIAGYLEALGLESTVSKTADGEEKLDVIVPSHRNDLEREIDLVEEVARLYGYDNIEPVMPTITSSLAPENQRYQVVDRIREILKGLGLQETVTYSFINPARLMDLDFPPDSPKIDPVRLKNPLSEEMSVLRTSLFPGMAETISRNVNKQNRDVGIFEIGNIFLTTADETALPNEILTLGIALCGNAGTSGWNQPAAPVDFFHLKGLFQHLADSLGIGGLEFHPNCDTSPYHPGRCAELRLDSKTVGYMGEIHPRIAERFDVPRRTYTLEIDLMALVKLGQTHFASRTPPRYPKVLRDLALVVPDQVKADQLEKTIRDQAGDYLESLNLFDYYTGDQLETGLKSLGFSLALRKPDGTLTEEEVESIFSRVLAAASSQFGACLRT